jgi:predicted dehydrogenase
MAYAPKTNRRRFLQCACASGAALAVPTWIPSASLGLDGRTAPSNRIHMAAIGMGFAWQMFVGRDDVRYLAVCDVRKERRDAAKAYVEEKQGRGTCSAVNDFREVLGRKDVDAVYIATPDHWHSLITIAAAKAGKHVYCQKPLTRTIAEGRAVVEAVRRYRIVFQHGTQQRHDPRMLFGCELVLNGYIGQLNHVEIGSPAGLTCAPQAPQPVPPGLDWEMWLGPAPWAPFTPLRIQSHPWYHISDYSMGYIAGWGVHHADSAMQGSGLDENSGPIEIDARGTFPAEGLFDNPYNWNMNYRFANGVTWNWTDTASWEPRKDWSDRVRHNMGIRLEGTEGWVFIWRGEVDAHPKKLLQVRIGPRDKVRLREHLPGDFIECVREGKRTCAPVEVAHRSTTLCSIAAIGMLLGRKLTWDPAREQFVGDDEANRLCARHMRAPWGVL